MKLTIEPDEEFLMTRDEVYHIAIESIQELMSGLPEGTTKEQEVSLLINKLNIGKTLVHIIQDMLVKDKGESVH